MPRLSGRPADGALVEGEGGVSGGRFAVGGGHHGVHDAFF